MWICHCNPFDDKAVKQCLDGQKGDFARVSSVYKACSGGKSPNCGTCIAHLQDMVMEHNREATVANLAQSVTKESVTKDSVGKEKADPAPASPANPEKSPV
jgi:bacterioferritin-associated ferredoxin